MLNNPFENSNTNKRYYTLDYFFKNKYNSKIARIPINAGFTCPNINGEKGFGGCTFCNTKGSGDFAGKSKDSLLKQWENGKKMMLRKWPNAEFLAYFQAFTNTYAPLDVLQEKFNTFKDLDECVGLSIATRPDCLEDETIDYIASLNETKYTFVELGLQTIHEHTAQLINRQHNLECFEIALDKLNEKNIDVVVHIINGLPGENQEDMLETVKYLANKKIKGIKIHLLHVMDETILVRQLNNNFLKLMEKDDYIDTVIKQLEILPPNIVIHRLTGDAPSDIFIGPIWSKKKVSILNDIDKELVLRNSYQGKKYESSI